MEPFGFVTISDRNYFPGVVALVNSIRRNSPGPITVIDEGLTDGQRNWLHARGVETRKVMRSIDVNNERFGCCYALFDIDAAPYEKLICVDPDAIVLEDIRPILTNLQDHAIAACSANLFRTLLQPDYQRKLRHAFPRQRWNFLLDNPHHILNLISRRHTALCSGIVAVSRRSMADLRQAAEKYSRYYADFHLPDQDLLSVCVADLDMKCALLPFSMNAATLHATPQSALADEKLKRKYEWVGENVHMHFQDGHLEISPLSASASDSFQPQRVSVLHYAGPDKPWIPEARLRSGFRELWQQFHEEPEV